MKPIVACTEAIVILFFITGCAEKNMYGEQYARVEYSWSKEGFSSKDRAKDVSRCIARAQEKYTGEKDKEDFDAYQKQFRSYYYSCLHEKGYERNAKTGRDQLINEVMPLDGRSIIDRDLEASKTHAQASDICWEEAHSKLPPEGYETNSHNRTNFFEQCMLDAGYTFHPKGISGKAKSSCYQLQRNSPACNSVPFSREIR